jgi:sugar phosphate permease
VAFLLSEGGGFINARPFSSTAASTCTKNLRPELVEGHQSALRLAQGTHPSSKEISMADSVALSPERRFELSEQANRKVFKRLIPFLLLMYVIAFLDRSNVSFAQEEFEADFGISTAAYAFGAGLFFVGYAIFEIPSNLLLHRVGAKWWLSRIMVTWGIVAAAFVFVQGPISFYILRFLLGVMEAGFFPGVILFLTYWVPARHLSRARGYF